MSAAFLVQFSLILVSHTSCKNKLPELPCFIDLILHLIPNKRHMLPLINKDWLWAIVQKITR